MKKRRQTKRGRKAVIPTEIDEKHVFVKMFIEAWKLAHNSPMKLDEEKWKPTYLWRHPEFETFRLELERMSVPSSPPLSFA